MNHDSDSVEPWWCLDTELPGEYSLVPIHSSHCTLLFEKLKPHPFSSSSSSSTQNTALWWLPQDTSLRFDCQNVITQPSHIPEILSTPIIFTWILKKPQPSAESQPRLSSVLWLKSYPCRLGCIVVMSWFDLFGHVHCGWSKLDSQPRTSTLSHSILSSLSLFIQYK